MCIVVVLYLYLINIHVNLFDTTVYLFCDPTLYV
jgi:hypothetical protein